MDVGPSWKLLAVQNAQLREQGEQLIGGHAGRMVAERDRRGAEERGCGNEEGGREGGRKG